MKNSIIEKAQKATIKAEIIERLVTELQNMIKSEESEMSYYNDDDCYDADYKAMMVGKIKLKISIMEEVAESLVK